MPSTATFAGYELTMLDLTIFCPTYGYQPMGVDSRADGSSRGVAGLAQQCVAIPRRHYQYRYIYIPDGTCEPVCGKCIECILPDHEPIRMDALAKA
jgi:hypothetical protein